LLTPTFKAENFIRKLSWISSQLTLEVNVAAQNRKKLTKPVISGAQCRSKPVKAVQDPPCFYQQHILHAFVCSVWSSTVVPGTSCTSAMHDITRKTICALLEKKKKKKVIDVGIAGQTRDQKLFTIILEAAA